MEDLPEVAVMIEKLNQEYSMKEINMKKKLIYLKKEIKPKDKYEPTNKDTVTFLIISV